MTGWNKQEHAQAVLALLQPGSYVNLGIGMPGLITTIADPSQDLYFHCENGLIGYRDLQSAETPNPNIIDAASKPVALIPGASVVAHDVSFAIARGGRLDATILGAYQVDRFGSFANWKTPDSIIAGVGGAMDLAVGAKQVIIMMKHLGKNGEKKILNKCTFPLTAHRVVDFIVTEFAVMKIDSERIEVVELAPGVSAHMLQEFTEPELVFSIENINQIH